MRLYKYLNEDIDIDEVGETLSKECSEYIEVLRNLGNSNYYDILPYFLVRGTQKPVNGMVKVKPRKSRKPKDMPEKIHEMLDELFKEEFGGYARSEGVFATSDDALARDFGRPYIFFPANRYKFVYSEDVTDLLLTLENEGIILDTGIEKFPNTEDYTEKELDKKLQDIVNTYNNRNLEEAIKEGQEITFRCKYYYLLETGQEKELAKKITGES